jgi:hypothetical protein
MNHSAVCTWLTKVIDSSLHFKEVWILLFHAASHKCKHALEQKWRNEQKHRFDVTISMNMHFKFPVGV